MSSSCYFCLLFLLSFFHLCLSTQNFNHVLCKDVERQALLQFKHGLIHDGANKLASWVSEEKECCSWAGIVCDNITGHVHQIQLRGLDNTCRLKELARINKHKLGRDLSPSVLQLKQLRYLDLSCNDFEGIQIPSFLGSLRNLRYLNLSNSGFAGIIPPQLGNLSELQVLGLKSFHDDGQLRMLNMQWLSSLHLLRHLDMSGVDLSKAIDWFQVINTLPSLAELYLYACQLSHIHPHVSSLNITSLTLLDLSRNHFANISVPWWIFSTTSLVSLDLSWCFFQGPTHGSIDGFHNLTSLKFLHATTNNFMNSTLVLGSNIVSLDISFCHVSSSGLAAIHNLTSLLSLDLSDNQLTKGIPKSFGNLCNLREIDLSFNHFDNTSLTHHLESFLECKSPCLESLALRYTGLSGHLPDQLGQLIHLVNLDLRSNNFVGVIPNSVGGLLLLERLNLLENRLNGSFPESLGQLSKLKYLDFSSNLLTGVVTEAHFAKLTGLKVLKGTGNNIILRPQLSNWIPPFQLNSLSLKSWCLGPKFPSWLQSQRDLRFLDISNTNISAPVPRSFFSSFPNMTYLDMSHNHLQGTLLSFPATRDGFDLLDLSSNAFTGKLPHLSDGFAAYLLDLSNNSFTGSLDNLLCPYDAIRVEALNLGNNHLSGVIPECWVKWQSLFYLNLENNNLSGGVPKTLGFSNRLAQLNMRGNKLSGRLPASLMNLTNLQYLQLGRNELVGSIPTWIGTELSDLRSLGLRSNNFDGNIPRELCYLTKIRILDLGHNNLSGNIPRCFNNFSVLSGKESGVNDACIILETTTNKFFISESLVIKGREDMYNTILRLVSVMDLSCNNFVGHIPSELMALQKLNSLNLSRNQLIGRIPEKIGDMKSLESFDLSLNKLSGELPVSLSSLNFLSNFNVSYNNLTGRIPSSTQLQSLNESSFIGNNLCGDPLTKQCAVEGGVINQEDEKEEEEDDGADMGLIISMVVGLVTGFWMIVGPLMVIRSWRIAYFGFLSRVGYMVYDVMHKYCCYMFSK